MEKREQALILMEELRKCRPQIFLDKIDLTDRGIHFVLGYLIHHNEEVISSDLSNALNVSTARMAKLLNKMEANKLLIKKHSNDDARKTVVVLTQKGIDKALLYKETLVNVTMNLIDQVGYNDLQEFVRISYKMKNAMVFDGRILEQLKKIDEQI